MKLSPKQRLFVSEYLENGLNATKAAESAGYSKKTARSQGARLLLNVAIAEAVAAKTEKLMTKLDISVERTLDMVGQIAFFEPSKIESVLLLGEVKTADRLSALDKLMRFHSLYHDKVEHTHTLKLEDLVMGTDAGE